jgi:hypothetical protein
VSARRIVVLLVGIALAATGCATTGTRSGHLGVLDTDAQLVTLVVSEDSTVVRGECPLVAQGNVLGCQTSRKVALPDGRSVRLVKIVRFTDRLPSAMAFEIDIHELCHAVAALQAIDDPCHAGNGGVVQHPAALPRNLLLR